MNPRTLNYGTEYFFRFLRNELPNLTRALEVVGWLGHPLVLLPLILLACLWLWRRGQQQAAGYLLVLTLAGAALSEGLKWALHWPRPQGWSGPFWLGPSLPSTGAVLSCLACVTLGRAQAGRLVSSRTKIIALAAWFLPAMLVAFAQLHLGQHWLFDVLIGWLLAAILILSCDALLGGPLRPASPEITHG